MITLLATAGPADLAVGFTALCIGVGFVIRFAGGARPNQSARDVLLQEGADMGKGGS